MQRIPRRFLALTLLALAACGNPAGAADGLVEPSSVRKVYGDGKHNAFTALVSWRDRLWLAFRNGPSHGYGEADLIVLSSPDGGQWTEVHRVNALPDDRDPQFLATPDRLFLYDPALRGTALTSFVTWTDDGRAFSAPRPVYLPRYILWKPLRQGDAYWATAHLKAESGDAGRQREVHLIRSADGLDWTKVSTIRGGNWESETTLHFLPDGRLLAFLRQKYSVPGFILEADPPYEKWQQRPAGTHFSGHAVTTLAGVTYLFSRTIDGDRTGTMIYILADGKLTPYCALPSGGDCSYPAAVQQGDRMLVSYYSSHEGAANIYLATVPLARPGGGR